MMSYEKKVAFIKLLQQLDGSLTLIATTKESGGDRYGDRIGANAYICKVGKRALLVLTPKARLDDHGDGLDYDEDDIDRDDFEGEAFFDSRPQFLHFGIHELDLKVLSSSAATELKSFYSNLDIINYDSLRLDQLHDCLDILTKLVDLCYDPRLDHQFGPPSKILNAWLGEGLEYSVAPGFGYLDGTVFLFEGKLVRETLGVMWQGDRALAASLKWLVPTECINISSQSSLPFPENLRATIRTQDEAALRRQTANTETPNSSSQTSRLLELLESAGLGDSPIAKQYRADLQTSTPQTDEMTIFAGFVPPAYRPSVAKTEAPLDPDDPNRPETEADGERAGDLRRWRARRQSEAFAARSKPSPK